MTDKSTAVVTSLGFGIISRPGIHKDDSTNDARRSARKARILVISGDPTERKLTTTRLDHQGYSTESVQSADAGLDACVRSRPHLVFVDLDPDAQAEFALLRELKSRWPRLIVIVLSTHQTIADAIRATQLGAFSYLVKPVQRLELLDHVKRAISASEFTLTDRDWTADSASRVKLMDDRIAQFNVAARSSTALLLTGDSAAGKALLARSIHAASSRRRKPFVAVSCRIAVESWLERRLFGQIDSDMTTKLQESSGALSRVRGGTLLIEEIGNLPITLQGRLLEELGHARLICTTSCELRKLLDIGQLTKDLFERIGAYQIEIPPLGCRREDIPRIISHFLEQAAESADGPRLYSREKIQHLVIADWPDNVRQLFELVKQNATLSGSTLVSDAPKPDIPTFDEARDDFSREYLAGNLRITKGNVSKSARLAKRNRTDFYKLLSRYRLRPDDFKKPSARLSNSHTGSDRRSTD